MPEYTQSKLAKFTKKKLVSMLEKEGIEASTSQKKSELIKLLILAHKANQPTKFKADQRISPAQRRRFMFTSTLVVVIILTILLYNFNSTFNQNVKFIAFNVFGIGEHPSEEGDGDGPTIYEKNGKTYVVYDFPIIRVKVITDKRCTRPECDLNNYYNQIKNNITPLVKFEEVDLESRTGKSLLKKFDVNLLPVFIFDKHVEEVDNFENSRRFFSAAEDKYLLQVTPLIAIEGPDTSNGRILGIPLEEESPLEIIEFTSFSSPHAKDAVPVLREVLRVYDGNIRFVFKYTYKGDNDLLAAVAAECAGNQGAFIPMHDLLFDRQDEWLTSNTNSLASIFSSYAVEAGINRNDFRSCFIDSDSIKERIEAHNEEANSLVVSGTPTFFVNNNILAGAYPLESMLGIIDGILEQDDIELEAEEEDTEVTELPAEEIESEDESNE